MNPDRPSYINSPAACVPKPPRAAAASPIALTIRLQQHMTHVEVVALVRRVQRGCVAAAPLCGHTQHHPARS